MQIGITYITYMHNITCVASHHKCSSQLSPHRNHGELPSRAGLVEYVQRKAAELQVNVQRAILRHRVQLKICGDSSAILRPLALSPRLSGLPLPMLKSIVSLDYLYRFCAHLSFFYAL